MERKKMPGRCGLVVRSAIAAVLLLSAAWVIVDRYVPSKESLDGHGEPGAHGKHNIVMYAWDYRPGFQPQGIGAPNTEIKRVAQEYMKLHPDVHIDFRVVGVQGDATEGEWMKPQLMERIAPDIIGANTEVVWPDVGEFRALYGQTESVYPRRPTRERAVVGPFRECGAN